MQIIVLCSLHNCEQCVNFYRTSEIYRDFLRYLDAGEATHQSFDEIHVTRLTNCLMKFVLQGLKHLYLKLALSNSLNSTKKRQNF